MITKNGECMRGACGWIRQRYLLAVLAFSGLANCYIHRFCLSLAITEMVITHKSHSKIDPTACPIDLSSLSNSTVHITKGEFNWDEKTQGMILSAFFWGYVVTQLPGGLLAERLNAKVTLLGAVLISSVLTLVTPVVARSLGPGGLITLRLFLGLAQGPVYPSLNVLLSKWAPASEKQRLGALVFAGAQLGTVISMALSGILMFKGGWTIVFYVYSVTGLLWAALWQIFGASSPEYNRFITTSEFNFLSSETTGSSKKDIAPTPWKSIFTSVPLWGLIAVSIGHDWGLFTIITDLPKYMSSVLHFPVEENGFWTAAPYVMMWLFAMFCAWAMDYLITVKKYSNTIIKKFFTSIASIGPAVGIVAATYAGCNRTLTALCFTAGMGLMGAFLPSLKVNSLDLAPNYAGILMALTGGIGGFSGAIAPYLVGVLTPDSTMLQWRSVFWIAVGILVSTNIIYLIMGSAEVQPWNEPNKKRDSESVDVKI